MTLIGRPVNLGTAEWSGTIAVRRNPTSGTRTPGRQAPDVPWDRLRSLPRPRPETHNGTLYLVGKGGARTSDIYPLWISELTTNFGISGNFAQSAMKRDFYPRSFNQPSYLFSGETFNEQHYGQLGEFIRDGQLNTIINNEIFEVNLPAAGSKWVEVPGKKKRRKINRNLKGHRQGIKLQGYINSIDRKHERFIYAPTYEFEFVVSQHLAGPIKDEAVKPHILLTNWDTFVNRNNTRQISDPDEALLGERKDSASRPEPQPDDEDVDLDRSSPFIDSDLGQFP